VKEITKSDFHHQKRKQPNLEGLMSKCNKTPKQIHALSCEKPQRVEPLLLVDKSLNCPSVHITYIAPEGFFPFFPPEGLFGSFS